MKQQILTSKVSSKSRW